MSTNSSGAGPALARKPRHHDQLAEVYDRWLSGDESAAPCLDFYVERLRRYSGPVLELGVGTGRIGRALGRDRTEIVGLDHSFPMLHKARQAVPGLPLVRGAFQTLPFRDAFNVVICPMRTIGYLMTAEERSAVFSQVFRALKPGGRFIFDHYNIDLAWATAHDGVPILMHAGKESDSEGVATLIWDRYDYDFGRQRLHCTVKVEQLRVGGDVIAASTTEFDFGWFCYGEIETVALEEGYEIEACYGDFAGATFSDDSEHMVWVLQKPDPGSSAIVSNAKREATE